MHFLSLIRHSHWHSSEAHFQKRLFTPDEYKTPVFSDFGRWSDGVALRRGAKGGQRADGSHAHRSLTPRPLHSLTHKRIPLIKPRLSCSSLSFSVLPSACLLLCALLRQRRASAAPDRRPIIGRDEVISEGRATREEVGLKSSQRVGQTQRIRDASLGAATATSLFSIRSLPSKD